MIYFFHALQVGEISKFTKGMSLLKAARGRLLGGERVGLWRTDYTAYLLQITDRTRILIPGLGNVIDEWLLICLSSRRVAVIIISMVCKAFLLQILLLTLAV
jgi:hypothetical protein